MNIYLDNAATTPIDPLVVEAMLPVLKECYGNPSSIHSHGRAARSYIERARKQIAKYFNASPSEFFFTSGGTEADNMILRCAVEDLNVERIITSRLEHHAVLHTAEYLIKHGVNVDYVKIDEKGKVDLNHLEELLKENSKTLVSLMHGNNEIATLLPLKKVGDLCYKYKAYFHSDTVQTMAHYAFDFKDFHINFATCSAHKFNGPKGIGFLYLDSNVKINPMITGGGQERNMRAGTENIYGIVGLAKALELAYDNLENHQKHIQSLKSHMIKRLKAEIPGVSFNGDSESEDSLYTVLNVSFPSTAFDEMFLYSLDIKGISASGGSACSSGANVGSHVLNAIGAEMDRPAVRFSFGRFNTLEEIDRCVEVLKTIYQEN